MSAQILKNNWTPRKDRIAASIFVVGIAVFLALMIFNTRFFNWAFMRHHNVLSWYIRPLFLIPFCYFSYQRTLAGVMATI